MGWQQWTKAWDRDAVALMQAMANDITTAQEWRGRLPEPSAVDVVGTTMLHLEARMSEARVVLAGIVPPGVTMESELKKADAACAAEYARLRAEMAKPGAQFVLSKVR